MDLNTYLAEKEESGAEFARRVGTSRFTISVIRAGKRLPSLKLGARIWEETKGKVSWPDWDTSNEG